MANLLAAVDIGGTKVTASVSDSSGILAKVRESTCLEGDERALPRQVDAMIARACDGREGRARRTSRPWA